MDREQVIKELQSSADSRVKLAVVDIDGILRGKVIHKEKLFDALENNLGFCDVIFGWDSEDQLYQRSKVTGWHTGFPDAKARIDLSTYRKIPWEEDIPFFLADFSHTSHPACPRSLLKKVISKAKDMGFDPVFAAEFEWFNFLRPEERTDVFARPQPMTSGMFGYSVLRASQKSGYFNDLFTQLEAFGIPMEGIHTETGPGVYEACIRSTDILEAADRAVIFKTAVKEIASRHGLVASFMAKWNATLPGCSGHLHQSLWKNGRNVFFDSKSDNHMSIVMRQYIAGQLACMSDVLPMYAPTINSYKRLVEGAWAPTHVTWGIDNRTTALRVINGRENSTRLENRAAGSDINPYLA
ncbi:MAG: glutamine synthetase, partial [Cyclobacteriaceae bacterium]|nr:glutamine synthetase [Cyclobacteriaceae bacterium HetDA_MAG_MS6]